MQPVGVGHPHIRGQQLSRTRPNPRRWVACATIPFVVGCVDLYLRSNMP